MALTERLVRPSFAGRQEAPRSVERKTPWSSVPTKTVPSSTKAGEMATACTASVSRPRVTARQARAPLVER